MENKKIICNQCSTENEEKYDYCKNCGTKLEKSDNKPQFDSFSENGQNSSNNYQNSNNTTSAPPPNYNQNSTVYGNTFVETINGIPYGEVAVFVGKKANDYMPVFSKMEITGARTAWHWPCAILSFFLGPLGTALWFFYRKMYKLAAILAVIGVIVTVASAVIVGPTMDSIDVFEVIFGLEDAESLDAELLKEATLRSEIANIISSLAGLVCAVVCGLFTHSWYKEHIHNSILKYRASNTDMRYYQMGLMSIGGTSGGMLALGIAIMALAENITTVIYAALSIF